MRPLLHAAVFLAAAAACAQIHRPAPAAPRDFAVMAWGGSMAESLLSLAHSFRFDVKLRQEGRRLLRVSPYSGREEPFGREMDWLTPGAGVLLRAE